MGVCFLDDLISFSVGFDFFVGVFGFSSVLIYFSYSSLSLSALERCEPNELVLHDGVSTDLFNYRTEVLYLFLGPHSG